VTVIHGKNEFEVNLLNLDFNDTLSQLLSNRLGESPLKPLKKPKGEGKKLIDYIDFEKNKAILFLEGPKIDVPINKVITFKPCNVEIPVGYLKSIDMPLNIARTLIEEDGQIDQIFFFLDLKGAVVGKGNESRILLKDIIRCEGEEYVVNLKIK